MNHITISAHTHMEKAARAKTKKIFFFLKLIKSKHLLCI